MDTRIYVMTHKKIAEIPDPAYVPLHVGRAAGNSAISEIIPETIFLRKIPVIVN